MRVRLSYSIEGLDGVYTENYPADSLADPAEIRARRYGSTKRVSVNTQEEAADYGASLISAFNDTCRPGEAERTLISSELVNS